MTVSNAASDPAVEQVVVPALRDLADDFKIHRALPVAQRRMVGPFIRLDHLGPAVFRAGSGLDIAPHPHIGVSTLTYLLEGQLIHRDSLGNVRGIRAGDVNWMTAGRGIVHSERTPARERTRTHTLSGQRIWVALPRALEDRPPDLSHHAESELPCIESDGASLTIVAGEAFNRRSPVPVHSDLMYLDVVLKAGARLKVPSRHIERAAFVISGEIGVNGQDLCYREMQLVVFKPGAEIVLQANSGAHVMLLGGEPFPEPRHVYWNFVSSSQDRIRQAAEDWRNGGFPRIAGESVLSPLPQPDDLAAW